jgi:hypothetical protein
LPLPPDTNTCRSLLPPPDDLWRCPRSSAQEAWGGLMFGPSHPCSSSWSIEIDVFFQRFGIKEPCSVFVYVESLLCVILRVFSLNTTITAKINKIKARKHINW